MLESKIANNLYSLIIINQGQKEDIVNVNLFMNKSLADDNLISQYTELKAQQNANLESARVTESEILNLLKKLVKLKNIHKFIQIPSLVLVFINAIMGVSLIILESENNKT